MQNRRLGRAARVLASCFVLFAAGCSDQPEDAAVVLPEGGGSAPGSGAGGASGSTTAGAVGQPVRAGSGGAPATAGSGTSDAGAHAVVVSAPGCTPDLASIQSTLFTPSCTLTGCHGAKAPAGALDLSAVATSQASLLGVSAALCDGATRVVAGSADESLLYLKLAAKVPQDCGEPMPIGAMLDPGALRCVQSWIDGLPPVTTDPNMPDPSCEMCGTGACVDTATSASHCGACGVACPAGASCQQGACRCSGDAILCDGQCSATCECAGTICNGRCMPSGVSFAKDVAPILANECAQSGCHGKMAPKEGLALTSDKAFAAMVSVAAAQCNDGRKRVTPGDPGASYLIDKLLGVDLCKGSQMPKAGQGLPAAQIDKISAWVCAGGPNN